MNRKNDKAYSNLQKKRLAKSDMKMVQIGIYDVTISQESEKVQKSH